MGAEFTFISLPHARVLVVDDVPTNLSIARGFMKRYGMQIDCVNSGPEAIDAFRNESVYYNAIFMDHLMPGMDGVEAARLIRELGTDSAKNVPIIAFTANDAEVDEAFFLQRGFQAFISKPIVLAQLDAVIREWIGNIREKREPESGESPPHEESPPYEEHGGSSPFDETIPGINFVKGLERFGGDEKAYISVLRSYATNTAPLIGKAQYLNIDQMPEYATIFHGIKGSSRGICAEELASIAEALEVATKSGDYDYAAAHNGEFIEAARKLLTDLNGFLAQIEAGKVRQKREKPDSETLSRLREACHNHDINRVDALVSELDNYEYEEGGVLVEWLLENAELMNYSAIARRLKVEG